ncbi:hypothetical protein BU14_1395s0003 [Porphyra umbilicalis]|uniref:Uncharacterized protein n=1 Tax=Porphyra umbilicalis TaxID=2786 RepID=A0A1X6NLY8_PORUM|nr:hypothetical protein BU14_1395s0003 [Porphyra umbilicalis]|eukprot:TRINITY_DN1895_c0_g1_i3.p1 TRINITY_DN1895_c0_g1~~TRINITY_DN1895_c0_g1_i3.p1  ORF type:complete len:182 (-),score=76.55 TRINITY_DN1895_c0_g1_i3:201-746(-)
MGNAFSWLLASLFGDKEARILILGLDNAGKTSILYRLKEGTFHSTVPTIGFNAETLEVGKLKAQVWDLGGQESIRPYWRSYFSHQEAVVFVVDSCDSARLDVARRELMAVLDEEELRSALVCVLANKQDRPEAMPAAAIAEALSLTSIRDRKWTIISASALRGEGLKEGFQWIAAELDNKS